jgi:acyl-[acyl-carrier-protein] desaturase
MAAAGIYDLRIHHDDVVMPLLRHWGVFELDGLGARGEQARDELDVVLSEVVAKAERYAELRSRTSVRRASAGQEGD